MTALHHLLARLRSAILALMHLRKKPRHEDETLEQIKRVLVDIQRRLTIMSSQEQELDAAIAEQSEKIDTLVADVTELKTAVDALIASIPPGVDLTDEIAAVQAAGARVDTSAADVGAVSDEAEAATPPPPA